MAFRRRRNRLGTMICLIWSVVWLTACSAPQSQFHKTYDNIPGEPNQHVRLIDASPERIFKILTHQESFTALVPEYAAVTFDSETYSVGTRLTTHINHLLEFTWHSQVQEIVPNQKIRLEFMDGLFMGGAEIWEMQPHAEKTLVMQTIVVAPRGWIRKFIWNLKARRRHNIMVEKFLDSLKEMAETPTFVHYGQPSNA